MLETFDGGGASSEAWGDWVGHTAVHRRRHEVRSSGAQAGLVANGVARLSFQDVLQYAHLREAGLGPNPPSDLPGLNERLLCVLNACHEVDTARRRLLSAMGTEQTLEEIACLLSARVGAGHCTPAEPHRLVVLRADIGRSVGIATEMWKVASHHFTRVTRLLPAQLGGDIEAFAPLAEHELEQLAQQAGRLGAGDCFAHAREAYRLAVMDRDLAQARWTRAQEARQLAEARFRNGRQGALALAETAVNQHWQCSSLAVREAHSCMKRHALHAIALMLPRQLGLG